MRNLGPEASQAHTRRMANGFYDQYLSGSAILDVGYRGTTLNADAITAHAIGIDLGYPGYDGRRLPFPDSSQDAVFSSHVLEHITDYKNILLDWYRVIRIGGYIIICVPHHYLYERRPALPSLWNPDHKRTYTPQSLLAEISATLPENGYRIRHLAENDEDLDTIINIDQAPGRGSYEIEIVLQKISIAPYTELLSRGIRMERHLTLLHDEMIEALIACIAGNLPRTTLDKLVGRFRTFPPWFKVMESMHGVDTREVDVIKLISPLLRHVDVNEDFYVAMYTDIAAARERGSLPSAAEHWRNHGYFQNRAPRW